MVTQQCTVSMTCHYTTLPWFPQQNRRPVCCCDDPPAWASKALRGRRAGGHSSHPTPFWIKKSAKSLENIRRHSGGCGESMSLHLIKSSYCSVRRIELAFRRRMRLEECDAFTLSRYCSRRETFHDMIGTACEAHEGKRKKKKDLPSSPLLAVLKSRAQENEDVYLDRIGALLAVHFCRQ